MTTVTTPDGAELYCEAHGEGEALLLVAGLGGNASFWTEQIPWFSSQYRVVAYDQRGAGKSTQSRMRYSVEQMAADALAVLDGLGIASAHLVGHSTGGCIGQVLAIEHPERLLSLVASSSWTAADPYFRRLFEVRKRALDEGGPEAYVRSGTLFQYPADWISQNIAAIESAEKAFLAAFPPIDIVRAKIDAILRFDRTADLRRIEIPTLVTTAMDDLICPPYFSRALAEAIPRARLGFIAEGGHFCPRSQPILYHRNVEGFLRSLSFEKPEKASA